MDEKEMRKKKIGSRIRVIRNELGLTMKEFGQKFDPPASDSIVSRWERGISSPNEERLKRISELGNVSMLYLTTGHKALVDLSDEEVKESMKNAVKSFRKKNDDKKESLKREFGLILDSELDFVETVYLSNMLDFLKFASAEQIKTIAAIMASINRVVNTPDELKATDEYKEFAKQDLEDVKLFLSKIYYGNNEGD